MQVVWLYTQTTFIDPDTKLYDEYMQVVLFFAQTTYIDSDTKPYNEYMQVVFEICRNNFHRFNYNSVSATKHLGQVKEEPGEKRPRPLPAALKATPKVKAQSTINEETRTPSSSKDGSQGKTPQERLVELERYRTKLTEKRKGCNVCCNFGNARRRECN